MVVTLRPNASRPRACIDSDSAVSDTVPSFDMADRTRAGRAGEEEEEEAEGLRLRKQRALQYGKALNKTAVQLGRKRTDIMDESFWSS